MGAYKQGKTTCVRTCGSKRGGAYFQDNKVIVITKLYIERRKISRRLKGRLKEYSATTDEHERYVVILCIAKTKTNDIVYIINNTDLNFCKICSVFVKN